MLDLVLGLASVKYMAPALAIIGAIYLPTRRLGSPSSRESGLVGPGGETVATVRCELSCVVLLISVATFSASSFRLLIDLGTRVVKKLVLMDNVWMWLTVLITCR